MRKQLFYLIIFGVIFVFSKNVFAADFLVSCDENSCTSVNQPIFNETNIVPLDSFIKTVRVSNISNNSITFAFKVENFTDSSPSLGSVINFKVVNHDTQSILMSTRTLKQVADGGVIQIGTVDANTSRDIDFTAQMQNVGNEYQLKSTFFDLHLGFSSVENPGEVEAFRIVVSTPTPTPESNASVDAGNILGEMTNLPNTGNSQEMVIGAILFITLGTILLVLGLRNRKPTANL